MKEIILTSSIYETSGGCNACVPYQVTVYKIRLNGIDYPLDELSVSNLVNMIARKNGYCEETITEMFEDKTFFQSSTQKIEFENESGILTYSNGTKKIQSVDLLNSKEAIFAKTNEILSLVFHIEPYEFIVLKDKNIQR